MVQSAGLERITFENEKEYLEFLKSDSRSGKLWADHEDLQVVANIYNIKIHILTIHIASKDGNISRWTHLVPDERIKSGQENRSAILGDMWLLHEDKTHFDLIIRKDSVLSEKEGIYQMNCDKNSETEGEINKHAAKEHIGCKCDKCVYKSKVECEVRDHKAWEHQGSGKGMNNHDGCEDNSKAQKKLQMPEEKEHAEEEIGPGYMGWKVTDKQENPERGTTRNIDEVLKKEVLKLKGMVRMLEKDMKKEKLDKAKEINELKNETECLKKDFKECMEAL